MKQITEKQREILDFIADGIAERSYPPSVREICAGVGIRSTATVHAHLKALNELGYLNKDEHKTRALSLGNETVRRVPLLGKVTAGKPITAIENVEGYIPFDVGLTSGEFFALNVQGDSMINAGILDGDVIVVRKQEDAESRDIVVALLGDEATVKRLRKDEVSHKVLLMPENPSYDPIDGTNCALLGKVTAVIRKY